MKFIESPNLPNNKVKVVLISKNMCKDALLYIEQRNIEAITISECEDIALPVACHPDMLFHHLGGNRIVKYHGADYSACKRLEELGFIMIESTEKLSQYYPNDIALNAARAGNFLICKKSHTDKIILDESTQHELHIISVKQGYAKCSVCVVDERSIITADAGIAESARKNGFDVLKIREGFINLPGYDSGFIGGCCGKLDRNKMAFCGDITRHQDYDLINNFLNTREIEIEILGNAPLSDIGSILPLMEED